ncbi:MAG TPA: ACT domain-containing protein [Candidatus Dormibacteraeota bacterium]|nr:ACT domain-containing protein [Candidatus Dormibacteraeota bacterium]
MKRLLAVAIMGRDRPGIVAAVSGALLELGGNVEDAMTSLLSGHFALMLVCSTPESVSVSEVRSALTSLPSDLQVAVWDLDRTLERSRPTHVLTVYGPDQPGIVHRVASVLAEAGVNICDMTCRLSDGALYSLTLELEVPPSLSVEELEVRLRGAVASMGLELTLGPIEAEVL